MRQFFLILLCCFSLYSVPAQGSSDTEATSEVQDTSDTEATSEVQDTSDTESTSEAQDASDTEATSEAQKTPQTELSSRGRLRYYGAEQEDFFVSPDYSSVVRATDGKLVQKKYDTQYRLIKTVTWAENGRMLDSVSEYTYEEEGAFPASSEMQEITSERFISEIYNTSGFVIQREVYSMFQPEINSSDTENLGGENPEDTDFDNSTSMESSENQSSSNMEASEEAEKMLIFTQNWEYDVDNRVVEEIINYAVDSMQSEKIEYRFLSGENKADVFYYNGDTLYKSTVYSSPDDWEERVYFPGEIEIITTYLDRTAVSEQFYQNGTKIRERKR